jgi:hypothetical protein
MIGVMTAADNLPLDAAAADALLAEFETGTISLDRFHHRQHLAVAAWLLLRDSHDSALDRMRAGLKHLLKVNGKTEGYDDELTVCWMRALAERLAACAPDQPPEMRLNDAVEWALEEGNRISDTVRRAQLPEPPASSGSTGE